MNDEQQLKLQSYLDGELSPRESRQVTEWLAVDADARALLAELKFTKTALVGNEPEVKLPESRHFYWSKIADQIEREANAAQRTPVREPIFARLSRYFLPLAGAAAAAVAFMVMSGGNSLSTAYAASEVETSDDMTAHVFRSQSDRMTVVWLEEKSSDASEETTDEDFEVQ